MPTRPVVILTRLAEDNTALAERLRGEGVAVIEYPCLSIRLIPWDGGLVEGARLEDMQAVAFSSKWGVAGIEAHAARIAASGALIAAVGAGTARRVEDEIGRAPDVIAHPATGEAMALALAERLRPGDLVLHVRGNLSVGSFRETLETRGMKVRSLIVYENVPADVQLLATDGPAVAVFASPSAAKIFFGVNAHLAVRCAAIGTTTAKRLHELGQADVAIARDASDDGLHATIHQLIAEMEKAHEF